MDLGVITWGARDVLRFAFGLPRATGGGHEGEAVVVHPDVVGIVVPLTYREGRSRRLVVRVVCAVDGDADEFGGVVDTKVVFSHDGIERWHVSADGRGALVGGDSG